MTKDENPAKSMSYRIQVDGFINPDWSDRFAGMTVASSREVGMGSKTTLAGDLQDQGELLGVLNTIYELGLKLERVEVV